MKVGTVKQQPNERRRYGVHYRAALDPGDFVESVSVTSIVPAGLTALASTDGEYAVRLVCEGGDDSTTYKVTMQVTTTNGNEILEDELYVKVKEL